MLQEERRTGRAGWGNKPQHRHLFCSRQSCSGVGESSLEIDDILTTMWDWTAYWLESFSFTEICCTSDGTCPKFHGRVGEKLIPQNKFKGIEEAKTKSSYYSVLSYKLQLVKTYCVLEAFIVDSHTWSSLISNQSFKIEASISYFTH